MVSKRLLGTPMLVLAGGCAVVGPIYDRSYEKAPYAACAKLTGGEAHASAVGQQPVGVGCFDIIGRTMSAGGSASPVEHSFTGEGLAITNNAAFRLKGGEGCTGTFTNFVVEYSAPEGGAAMLAATDGLGRVLGTARIRAKASPEVRRVVMREMGDPLKNPAVLEFGSVEGRILVRSVCLKGY